MVLRKEAHHGQAARKRAVFSDEARTGQGSRLKAIDSGMHYVHDSNVAEATCLVDCYRNGTAMGSSSSTSLPHPDHHPDSIASGRQLAATRARKKICSAVPRPKGWSLNLLLTEHLPDRTAHSAQPSMKDLAPSLEPSGNRIAAKSCLNGTVDTIVDPEPASSRHCVLVHHPEDSVRRFFFPINTNTISRARRT